MESEPRTVTLCGRTPSDTLDFLFSPLPPPVLLCDHTTGCVCETCFTTDGYEIFNVPHPAPPGGSNPGSWDFNSYSLSLTTELRPPCLQRVNPVIPKRRGGWGGGGGVVVVMLLRGNGAF